MSLYDLAMPCERSIAGYGMLGCLRMASWLKSRSARSVEAPGRAL